MEALDAFLEHICELFVLKVCDHSLPALDEEFETWDDVPDSGHMLTGEHLLVI